MNIDFSGLEDIDLSSLLLIILPFALLHFILLSIALIDLIRKRNQTEYFYLWIFLITFLNTLGPIVYFIFGRGRKVD